MCHAVSRSRTERNQENVQPGLCPRLLSHQEKAHIHCAGVPGHPDQTPGRGAVVPLCRNYSQHFRCAVCPCVFISLWAFFCQVWLVLEQFKEKVKEVTLRAGHDYMLEHQSRSSEVTALLFQIPQEDDGKRRQRLISVCFSCRFIQ